MARVVHLSVVPHDPVLPAAAAGLRPNIAADTHRVLDGIGRLRAGLEASRPDCVVMAGSDHLCQFFYSNMPPFLIGKAERIVGPPEYEQRDWQLEPYDAPIQGRLARRILTEGYEHEVDFAFSDEFVADHAFTVPLNFMLPRGEVPIVPIFLNFLAPPVPPARRFLKLGGLIRTIIEEWDEDKVLWQVARDDELAAAFMEAPEAFLADRPLTEDEHRRLIERDFAGLFAAGAHPFLLYTFRIKLSGGFSFPLMVDYVRSIEGIEPPLDITT